MHKSRSPRTTRLIDLNGPEAKLLRKLVAYSARPVRVDRLEALRPRTRGDCVDGPRPCPWVSCRYHLYWDVAEGKARIFFPGLEIHQLPQTCSLDLADRGGLTLREVADVMGVSHERVRQIQAQALEKLQRTATEFTAEWALKEGSDHG